MTGKNTRHSYFFCSIAASVLILSACGLPTILYLEKPLAFFKDSENQLTLEHEILNYDATDQSFKGYEIYYRAYDNANTAQSDIDDLLLKANSVYSDYPAKFESYASSTLGYKTLLRPSKTSPTIEITTPALEATYYINLYPTKDWQLNSNSVDLLALKRTVSSDAVSSFYIASNYQSGDSDYKGSSNPVTIYFAFFAVAFGSDSSSFENVFSMPVIISSPIAYSPGL